MAVKVFNSHKITLYARYSGPTNTRGARVIVKARDGKGYTMLVSWDHALNASENFAHAAKALCDKHGWDGELLGGGVEYDTKRGEVFVFIPRSPKSQWQRLA